MLVWQRVGRSLLHLQKSNTVVTGSAAVVCVVPTITNHCNSSSGTSAGSIETVGPTNNTRRFKSSQSVNNHHKISAIPSLHKKAIKVLLNNEQQQQQQQQEHQQQEQQQQQQQKKPLKVAADENISSNSTTKENNNDVKRSKTLDSSSKTKTTLTAVSVDEKNDPAVVSSTSNTNTNNDMEHNDNNNSNPTMNPVATTTREAMSATGNDPSMSHTEFIPPVPLPHHNLHEFAPKIIVIGVGGAGGNALNNMIVKELCGVDFLALNTDAQHLATTLTDQRIQLGLESTHGLGCGANPDMGRTAAEETRDIIRDRLDGAHLAFITAGMGGGTGTGAAPVVADICSQLGILTVGVVTTPFMFEGTHRKKIAMKGIEQMQTVCDTLICIPNQNLFKLAGPKTTFVDAFQMADDVLLGGVRSITDLMTTPGLINLDFADVQAVMVGGGNALLGTGIASSSSSEQQQEQQQQDRAIQAAGMALDNPLLGTECDFTTAKGMLVNITGGRDMTLYEVDEAAQLITDKVKYADANIIFGSAFDERLEGSIRVSVVATGIEQQESSSTDGPAVSPSSSLKTGGEDKEGGANHPSTANFWNWKG